MGRLSIQNVGRVFPKDDDTSTVALQEINLEIRDQEFVCFLGPSGCGKTTLLRIIAGLETITTGQVLLNDEEISGPDPSRGMVFQEYSLFPWRTVIDNITFGLEMKGVDKKERLAIADEYLEMVGLSQFRTSFPHELSGGMRQRVAIARALANNPEVLLMDEPFGALDAQTRNTMQKELLGIWAKTKKTVLFVTHSVDEAVYLADRIIIFTPRPGRVCQTYEVTFKRPRDRTSNEFATLRRDILMLMQGCSVTQ